MICRSNDEWGGSALFYEYMELYRGYDKHRFDELCALLAGENIKCKTQAARPDSKVAAMYGAAGAYPGTPNTRQGYINQSSFWAEKELERTEEADKLYIIRIRTKDYAKVLDLIRKSDGYSGPNAVGDALGDGTSPDSLLKNVSSAGIRRKGKRVILLLFAILLTAAVIAFLLFWVQGLPERMSDSRRSQPASHELQQAVVSYIEETLQQDETLGPMLTGKYGYTELPVYRLADQQLLYATLTKQYWLLFSDETPVCFLTVYDGDLYPGIQVVLENWYTAVLQESGLGLALVEDTTGDNPQYPSDPELKRHCFCLYLSDGTALPLGSSNKEDETAAIQLSQTLSQLKPAAKWVSCSPDFLLEP